MKLTEKQIDYTYQLEEQEIKDSLSLIDPKRNMWFDSLEKGITTLHSGATKYVVCPSSGRLLDLRASGDPDPVEAAKDVIRQSVRDRWNAIRKAPQYCNIQFPC
jgi:hypothetical protein